jgi:hypothetical protein
MSGDPLSSPGERREPTGTPPMTARTPGPGGLEEPYTVEVQNVRRDRRIAGARVLGSIIALVAVPWGLGWLGFTGGAVLGALAMLVAYFWSAMSLAATDRGPGERRLVNGSANIAGDHLVVTARETATALPLSLLDGGWTEKTAGGHTAVLSFSDGKVVAVERPSEQEAIALLSAAGAGAHARAVRMRGYREDSSGRKVAGFLLAFFALLVLPVLLTVPILLLSAILSWSAEPLETVAGILVGFSPFLGILAWMWSKVTPSWIHIGADGVMLRGAFRRRFVPHSAIVRATPIKGGVADAYHFVKIMLVGGRAFTFPAASAAEALALSDRIMAARVVTSAQDRARLLEAISRNGRSVSEWRRAQESLVAKTGYRTAGHGVEEMMQIVEDATAPVEQRVAAALAARPNGGEAVQKRIRVAAEACVEPRLRIALESASAGEIEDEMLEEISRSEARTDTR